MMKTQISDQVPNLYAYVPIECLHSGRRLFTRTTKRRKAPLRIGHCLVCGIRAGGTLHNLRTHLESGRHDKKVKALRDALVYESGPVEWEAYLVSPHHPRGILELHTSGHPVKDVAVELRDRTLISGFVRAFHPQADSPYFTVRSSRGEEIHLSSAASDDTTILVFSAKVYHHHTVFRAPNDDGTTFFFFCIFSFVCYRTIHPSTMISLT